jgi:ribosome modulation factor
VVVGCPDDKKDHAMTYSLTTSGEAGTKHQTLDTAEAAVSKIDRLRNSGTRVKVTIDSEADRPGDLTESERLIIVKEGRMAAQEGRDAEDCPYADDDRRCALWLEGFRGSP